MPKREQRNAPWFTRFPLLNTSAFDLSDHLTPKTDPRLIAGDEQHFAAIATSLEQSVADLSDRLDAERRAPGGIGQAAMDRDSSSSRAPDGLACEGDALASPSHWQPLMDDENLDRSWEFINSGDVGQLQAALPSASNHRRESQSCKSRREG
jgi:hypothetical protein